VDEMVGLLVDELEAAGELDNTYIVFTSDNGF
jgi:N-acetylglucosamine-6-sulfatase